MNMTSEQSTVPNPAASFSAESLSADKIISLDQLGIAASSICLVHCLAMPFIITFLPFVGWQFLEGKTAHHLLAAFVFSFAIFGIVPGYLKHREKIVLLGMSIGLSLVLTATFLCGYFLSEKFELALITIGNLILVLTHWRNKNLSSCGHDHQH